MIISDTNPLTTSGNHSGMTVNSKTRGTLQDTRLTVDNIGYHITEQSFTPIDNDRNHRKSPLLGSNSASPVMCQLRPSFNQNMSSLSPIISHNPNSRGNELRGNEHRDNELGVNGTEGFSIDNLKEENDS